MNIYQIERQQRELVELLIENGGEITDDINLALQITQEQLQAKGISYGMVVKQLDSEVDIINSEIARLQVLKVSRTKTIDRLKDTLKRAMDTFEIEKIESPLMKISFRNSESVDVEDQRLIPMKYMVEKTTHTPDKDMIKKSIKLGYDVAGATIKVNRNLQIK